MSKQAIIAFSLRFAAVLVYLVHLFNHHQQALLEIDYFIKYPPYNFIGGHTLVDGLPWLLGIISLLPFLLGWRWGWLLMLVSLVNYLMKLTHDQFELITWHLQSPMNDTVGVAFLFLMFMCNVALVIYLMLLPQVRERVGISQKSIKVAIQLGLLLYAIPHLLCNYIFRCFPY